MESQRHRLPDPQGSLPDGSARLFALPPMLRAEHHGRIGVERLRPRARERCVIPTGTADTDAWAPVLARLLLARGVTPELLWVDGSGNPEPLFALMSEVCRRMGIPVAPASPEALAKARTADTLWGRGRWSATIPGNGATAWEVHWPDTDGEGMLHRVDASSPVLSCAEARAMDERAVRDYGLPGLCLMEQAGIGATAVARRMLERRSVEARSSGYALIAAGGGNNGGDALVVARGLMERGYRVRLFTTTSPGKFSPDMRANWDTLAANGQHSPGHPAEWSKTLADEARGADLLVDGLLGTGVKGEPRGAVREAIQALRSAEADGVPVLSLDLPSGLDGDTGQASATTVRATATVTFAAVKPGLLHGDGSAHAGDLYLADIGLIP